MWQTADSDVYITVCLVKIFVKHIKEKEDHCLILSNVATDLL